MLIYYICMYSIINKILSYTIIIIINIIFRTIKWIFFVEFYTARSYITLLHLKYIIINIIIMYHINLIDTRQ